MAAPGRRHPDGHGERFANARANQEHNEIAQQVRASRTVDSHATDPQDHAMLMAMLGLDKPVHVHGSMRHPGQLG